MIYYRIAVPVLLIAALPASGQRLEFGVKAGVPITDSFNTSSAFFIDIGEGATSGTRRYTVGPTVGLRLPHGLGVEFDALYSRLGFDDDTKGDGVIFTYRRTTANSWEFPMLGTYSLGLVPAVKPFVDGGVSFRTTSGVSSKSVQMTEEIPPPILSSWTSDPVLSNRSWYGAVIGLGIEAHIGRVHLSPEIRYTRWAADRNIDVYLHSNQNQFVFMLGITL